jgi:hypothetical protein
MTSYWEDSSTILKVHYSVAKRGTSKLFPGFMDKMCRVTCHDHPLYWISEYWLVSCSSKCISFQSLKNVLKTWSWLFLKSEGLLFMLKVLCPAIVQSTRSKSQFWKAQTLRRALDHFIDWQILCALPNPSWGVRLKIFLFISFQIIIIIIIKIRNHGSK